MASLSSAAPEQQRVAFFGDAFVDVQTSPMASLPAYGEDRVVSSVSIFPGGSVVNTARSFAALTQSDSVSVSLCVSLGSDHLGNIMLSVLEQERSIDLTHVNVCNNVPMSTCLVLVGPGGDRAFVSTRGTSNDMSNAALCEASGLLDSCTHVHVSGLFSTMGLQTKDFVQLLRRKKGAFGFTLSLDTQYDATEKWTGDEDVVLDLIRLADVFMPNDAECKGICRAHAKADALLDVEESSLAWLMEAAPDTLIVVKVGPDGAIVGRQGVMHKVPTPMKITPEQCVDTCGAGDAFAAAMLSRWVIGSKSIAPDSVDLLDAVKKGCLAGTWCCTRVGACARPVTAEDLESESV